MSGAPSLAELQAAAASIGIPHLGVTAAHPSEQVAAYRDWLEHGFHGEMAYLARSDAVARRAALEGSLEGVRSVVVVADPYPAEDPPGIPDDPSRGVIARYARGRDYHRVLAGKLRRLGGWLEDAAQGPLRWRSWVDTGPLLERDLARRAGLGWQGKNTMLLHPRRGSYFFLGVLLTDAELPTSEAFGEDHCGTCRACLDACPTGALLGRDASGAPLMDARRCISYLTIEHRGPIPEELRPLIGNRVFGCDICQEVCPFTRRFAEASREPAYAARGPGEPPPGVEAAPGGRHPGTEAPSLVELLETALDEARWDAFSRGSAIRRAGRAGFARNVCVALGNWGTPEARGALLSASGDPDALVREHAAWALDRIG